MTSLVPAFYVPPVAADVAERLRHLRRLGVRQVGTDGMDSSDHAGREAFARLIDELDLTVVSVHGVGPLVDAEGTDDRTIERLMKEVDRAAQWRGSHLILHFREAVDGYGWDNGSHATLRINQMGVEAFDQRVLRVLGPVCRHAQEKSVIICLENLAPPFSHSQDTAQIARFVRQANLPNLGICLDSGHAHLAGRCVPEQVRACGAQLATLHLHDNFGPLPPTYDSRSSDWHLAPGLGTIHWPQVILALRQVGYAGPAVFETTNVPGVPFDEAVAWILRFWQAALVLADRLQEGKGLP